MSNQFSRTELLLGRDALERLHGATVAIFGLGGVGGYVVEALARSGIGSFHLIDHDTISLTNLNRQILATWQTLGQPKVEVAAQRIHAIHPQAQVYAHATMFLPDTADAFDFSAYDYVVDAIDTVTGKLALVQAAQAQGTPILSCMGTGNKLNPGALQIADIYDTQVCPLARIMRRELKKRGIQRLKVLYSPEPPIAPEPQADGEAPPAGRHQVPGSSAYVPAVAGLLIAAEVVKDLTQPMASTSAFVL